MIETRGKGIFSKPNWYFDWHQPGWHRLYVHGLLWTVLFEMSLTGKSLIVLCPSSHKATKTKVSQMTNQIVDYYITKLYVLITCFGHSTARVWNICIYIYMYNSERGTRMICGSKCENGNCIVLHVLNMLRRIPNAQSLKKKSIRPNTERPSFWTATNKWKDKSLKKLERLLRTYDGDGQYLQLTPPPEMKHLPNTLPSTILSELVRFGRCI